MLTLQRRIKPKLFLSFLLVSSLFLAGAARSLPEEASRPAAPGWRINFDASGSNPVVADGVLYVGSSDGAVYALEPKSGETKWRFQTGESLSPSSSGPQIVTVPHGASVGDQMAAGMNAVEMLRTKGIRRVDMTPAVENGTVFIGAGDHLFYAIDAASGKKKWSYMAGFGMASSNNTSYTEPAPVLRSGKVYFLTEDGLHAVDALTGSRKWLFQPPQELSATETTYGRRRSKPAGLVLGDGVIFLTAYISTSPEAGASRKNVLYAIDAESGTTKWMTPFAGHGITPPTAARGLVFVATVDPSSDPRAANDPVLSAIYSHHTTLYAINPADGQVRWKLGAQYEYGESRTFVCDKVVYFLTDKTLLAAEVETGRQLWSFSADEIQRDLRTDEQHLYVVTHKGSFARPKDTLHALALATGQEKWSVGIGAGGDVQLGPDGIVYAGRGNLHAIEASTGKELWSFKGTGRETARLISGGKIFLTSPTVTYFGSKRVDQGYLYAIDAKTGKMKP